MTKIPRLRFGLVGCQPAEELSASETLCARRRPGLSTSLSASLAIWPARFFARQSPDREPAAAKPAGPFRPPDRCPR